MGKSPYQAAIEAADEIGLAVIAISLTIVAIFVPASFMQSVPGQFFKQFGITVSVQVLFSLLCARLITPMLAAYLLRPHHASREGRGLHPAALHAADHLVGPAPLHHHRDRPDLLHRLDLEHQPAALGLPARHRQGALAARDRTAARLAARRQRSRHRSHRQADPQPAGSRERLRRRRPHPAGRRRGPQVHASRSTTCRSRNARSRSASSRLEISRDLADIPDIRFWFLDENGKRNVTLIVTGQDNATVANVATELAAQMQRLPHLTNVVSTSSLNRPELRIYPRRDLAVRLGVSTESLSETIRVATIGDVGPGLAKFDAGDRIVPIRVLLEESARADRAALEADPRALAARRRRAAHRARRYRIRRRPDQHQPPRPAAAGHHRGRPGRRRGAQHRHGGDQDLPVMKGLPPGIRVTEAGDAELQAELFDGFGSAMRNGLMMVYVVLAVLFGSLLQPLTIMVSLPLALGGAIVGLLATNKPISAPVVIGILMLMGIVTKNAIMLVDFAIEAMRRGVDRTTAIIEAGRMRARPIVMTTIAMAAGMAPSALAIGAGGEFRSPMAIAVIGGLTASTLLSLLFVPTLFTLVDDIGRIFGRMFGRFIGPADEPGPPGDMPPPAPLAGEPPQAAREAATAAT